ncbi:MAG: pyruvate kinase [Pseudomonadota bacterium]
MQESQQDEQHALQWRRTKIIATLGPASASRTKIRQLVNAGVDVVRLNLSHGDHDSHRKLFTEVRQAGKRSGRHIPILMDLCGPKTRVGRFSNGPIELEPDQEVVVTTRPVNGHAALIPSQYRKLHQDMQPGERILLDDGQMELLVARIEEQNIHCTVIHGGTLHDNKGMNLPDTALSVSAFTRKDREDAAFAVEMGADFLALSFVRSAAEVETLQRYLKKQQSEIPVIAKIEKPEAMTEIEAIMQQAYGIMIARGDLGIELPAEQVPLIQRDLIQLARRHNKPVIVATQMLESMTQHSRPTRAEVGDVATAALSSSDAVMLSGETANGLHPLEAVTTMDRILREMERYQWQRQCFGEPVDHLGSDSDSVRKAIARAATGLASQLSLRGIIIPTRTGLTARIIAAARPISPCLGVGSRQDICRQLALHWGIVPILVDEQTTHNWRKLSEHIADSHALNLDGSSVLLISGFNEDPQLSEPAMKILSLEE